MWINEAKHVKQVLVIAHRLETILMAERVFLLDNGKLQELSHSALIERSVYESPPVVAQERGH